MAKKKELKLNARYYIQGVGQCEAGDVVTAGIRAAWEAVSSNKIEDYCYTDEVKPAKKKEDESE